MAENSTPKYLDDTCNNITLRNKLKRTLATYNSFEALTEISDKEDEQYASFNSTFTCPCYLNRSFPNLHSKTKEDIFDLRQRMHKLEEKLKIAENKIEKLLLENSTQAKQITRYEQRINMLGQICRNAKKSPVKSERDTGSHDSTQHFRNLKSQIPCINNTQLNVTPSAVRIRKQLSKSIKEPYVNKGKCSNFKKIEDVTSPSTQEKIQSCSETNESINRVLSVSTETSKCPLHRIRKHANKICIVSDNNVNNVLKYAEYTFPNSNICHYCMPNANIQQLLNRLDDKLKTFCDKDYCVIFLGENDFMLSKDYEKLVDYIKQKLEKLMHTNVILCLPNYKLKNNINLYNRRLETFNQLLYINNWTFQYTYIFDTNLNLEYNHKMFKRSTGKINNKALYSIFQDLKLYIQSKVDIYHYEDYQAITNIETSKERVTYKPGTIPYYFKQKISDRKKLFRQ